MNVQTDRALIPAGQPSIRYLTIAISAPARGRSEGPEETPGGVTGDARLVIAGATGTDIGCLSDLPSESVPDPATGNADVHVLLGDLAPAQEITVVLAVRCPPLPAGEHAAISLRLTDRDEILFAQPLAVDWLAVDENIDAAQPVGAGVLVDVATEVAARARAAAVETSRRGDAGRAAAILAASAADLRRLGAGIPDVRAIADALDAEPTVVSTLPSTSAIKPGYILPARLAPASRPAVPGKRRPSSP
jgi:hypothetical protein